MAGDWLLAAFDLVLVVVVARCGGLLALRVGQPRIAGELLGVVAIGPTVLGGQISGVVEGAAATGTVGALFPEAAVDALTWVGGLGLILYMLLVGLTIDAAAMVRRVGAIALLAVATTAASVLLAVGFGLWLASSTGWRAPSAGTAAFVLALAGALSAHGVPVVARILEERDVLQTDLGAVVVASGAGAMTIALILSGVAVKGGDGTAALRLMLILGAAAFVIAVVVAVSRAPRFSPPPGLAVALLIAGAIGAGVAGQTLVGTALVGPLVIGVLVGSAGASAAFIDARLGPIVRDALLPIFLGVAALHTNLRELGPETLLPVAAMLAAVIVAKLLAAYVAARVAGFDAGEARAVGALLQCGGIMTIAISLDVLHAGVISTRTHAALTLVGLVTTLIAGPLLARAQQRSTPPPAV